MDYRVEDFRDNDALSKFDKYQIHMKFTLSKWDKN